MKKPTLSRRIKAGMASGAAAGRKAGRRHKVTDDVIREVMALGLSTVDSAQRAGLAKSQFIRRRRIIEEGKSDG